MSVSVNVKNRLFIAFFKDSVINYNDFDLFFKEFNDKTHIHIKRE